MGENIITLTDENGNSVVYELLDIIKYDEKLYTVFYPTKANDTEISILRIEESEDPEKSLYVVEENQKIVREVYKQFKEKYKDEINFKE